VNEINNPQDFETYAMKDVFEWLSTYLMFCDLFSCDFEIPEQNCWQLYPFDFDMCGLRCMCVSVFARFKIFETNAVFNCMLYYSWLLHIIRSMILYCKHWNFLKRLMF